MKKEAQDKALELLQGMTGMVFDPLEMLTDMLPPEITVKFRISKWSRTDPTRYLIIAIPIPEPEQDEQDEQEADDET